VWCGYIHTGLTVAYRYTAVAYIDSYLYQARQCYEYSRTLSVIAPKID